jgi:hemolysin activation/secretion protein
MALLSGAAVRPLVSCASVLAIALGFGATSARAQDVPAQVPGLTREEVDPARRTGAAEPATIDALSLAQTGACPFGGQGEITLARVEASGATLVSQAEVDRAVADLIGRSDDLSILCVARDRVAALYADKGEALVRVDLPAQRIAGGVLTLQVTEGRIVDTVLRNPENLGPAAGLAQSYLGELRSGGVTSWTDVERAFLLTREIPGAEVGFSIRRADEGGADGLAAVAAFAPRRKLDISLNGHNFGSRQLGREGISLRVDANSFTSLAERTSLVLYSSLSGAQRVIQLLEEVRVGPSGLVLLGDVAYGETEPGKELEPLDIEGRSLVARLGARYPLVRTRGHSLDLGGRFELIDQKNDLGFLRGPDGDPTPLFEENLRVIAGELSGRWQPPQVAGLITTLNLELRKGLDVFGASEAGDPLLSRAEGQPGFTSVRLQAAARQGFGGARGLGPYVLVTGAAQWSDDPLPAYEEFQVGNYTIGRGYDPGAASGDRALAAQFEAGLDAAARGAVLTLFGFADVARLWNEDTDGVDGRPWSLGAGARARFKFGQLSLVYAAPQARPFAGAAKPGDRLLVTLSTNFSIR